MRAIFLIPGLLLSLAFFSCQKEVSVDTITGNNGNNGSSGISTYQPLSAGSFWTYKDSASGSTHTLTIINKQKTINNRLYTAVLSTASADTAYMAVDGADYFTLAQGNSPNTGASFDFIFHYLNDTAAVGSSWEETAGQGNGFTAYIKTTIKEKDITHTVAGKTFDNVIHTRLDLKYDIYGSIEDFGGYDYYIAKDVGVIEIISEFGTFGLSFRAKDELVDYAIK